MEATDLEQLSIRLNYLENRINSLYKCLAEHAHACSASNENEVDPPLCISGEMCHHYDLNSGMDPCCIFCSRCGDIKYFNK
jgi:hypothetical protein